MYIDPDIHRATALVVDANPTSRSVMAAQLRDMGVASVRQASRVRDARLALETTPFDIVLCELDFDGSPHGGQDLLDELRREQLLPYSTVFLMVTGAPTYARVMEAAEATIDGCLIKPYKASALAERLTEARRRKRTLKAVYQAIQKGEYQRAAELSQDRFDRRDEYWLFAGQVAAELWLRLDRPERAAPIFEAVAEERRLPWARLGVARARLAANDLTAAHRLLQALAGDSPDNADARDLLARVLVEQCDFAAALTEFRACVALTPGCVLRLQHCGTLAFYLGESDEAARMLERAMALGWRSKLFDMLSLALLALLRFDRGDDKGLGQAHDSLRSMCESFPQSVRLQRAERLAATLRALRHRKFDEVLQAARASAAECDAPDYDLEAASLTLALWSRLPRAEVPASEWDTLLRRVGRRFAVSRTMTEIMTSSVRMDPAAVETLRQCQHDVLALAEDAMNRSLRGRPREAVDLLLDHGAATRNAKLIEMAGLVARRHAQTIGDVPELTRRQGDLKDAYCRPLTHIAGIRRSSRSPGGLVFRH